MRWGVPTRLSLLPRLRYGPVNPTVTMTPVTPLEGRHATIHRARRRETFPRAGDRTRPRHRPAGKVGRLAAGKGTANQRSPRPAEGQRRVPGGAPGLQGK